MHLQLTAIPLCPADQSTSATSWGFYAFPLAWAAAQGDIDLVNQLLACDADPNLKGKSKKVSLNGVVIEGGWVIGGQLGSALHFCAINGRDEVARVLLERGADVNMKGQFELLCLV